MRVMCKKQPCKCTTEQNFVPAASDVPVKKEEYDIVASEIEEGLDEEGTTIRRFKSKNTGTLVAYFAIFVSLLHIYSLGIKPIEPFLFYTLHWGCGLILIFMLYPASNKSPLDKPSIIDLLFVCVALATILYVWRGGEEFQYRIMLNKASILDLIFGALVMVATLEAARRTTGLGLPIVGMSLVVYALIGKMLPEVIANKGFSISRIVTYMFSMDGIFGTAISMSATNVFLLILFSAFLHVSGAGQFFIDLAMSLCGTSRGGPAKVAVIASGSFGSISGSAVANVVGTGVFTIPLMKKVGYRSEFAAATEAVASTGGQIMPPVMGSGAFIMAELLSIPYATIVKAAIVPALLYYYSLFISIDLEAAKEGLKGIKKDDVMPISQLIKERGYLLIPIITLIYFMAIKQVSISRSALFAIAACVVSSWFNKKARMGYKDILKALELGAIRSLTVISATACAGIAIGAVILTGIGLKITFLMATIAKASMILSLVLSAVATIILGMGLPTVAAYIVAAAVLSPALINIGIPPLCSHMFLFYFSIMSMITPPVALAAYTAANISKSNMNTVGFLAMKLGAIAFMLPFFFVYGPALLMVGQPLEIIGAIITAFLGINAFTVAIFGWFRSESVPWVIRIILFSGGVSLIVPGLISDIIGLGLLLTAVIYYYIQSSHRQLSMTK